MTTKPTPKASGKKAGAKSPKPVEEQLKRHFNSLSTQIDGGHFTNAIKTLDPQDKDALDTKLFLFIQTEQYESALELIKHIPGTSESSHAFERAYLAYRLQKEEGAFEIVESARKEGVADGRALAQLEAQIKYRQTDYEGARDIYNELLETCAEDTDEYPDLVTNLNATQAHLDFLSNGYLAALNSLEVSVAALEDAGAPPLPSASSVAILASKSTPVPANVEPIPKAPRKSRLPKHVVLGVTPMPDPERWLKKRERTAIQGRRGKKGGRKEGMGVGATQGTAVPAERDAGSTSAPKASTTSSSGRGAGSGKKTKKR
ncbi:hypothetical protein FRB99_006940 [Tulasnella sp. 403]|nr:hypothetical protein FRB99_006940 [Tulasnella sp. 403]